MIARGWLEKKSLFEKQVESMGMEELDFLEREDEQGCPAMAEGRNVQYASIGLRQDVCLKRPPGITPSWQAM